jgi:hypothetical protein
MSLFLLIGALAGIAALYIIYFGLIVKPIWSIYAYLLIWLIVPKALRLYYFTAGVYDLPEGMTGFHIIEAIGILAILIAVIKHSQKQKRTDRGAATLRRFSWLFLIAGVVAMVVSLGALSLIFNMQLEDLWNFLSLHGEAQHRIPTIASMVYGVIFLYGCIAFLTTMKQVERILLFFLVLGVCMGLESLVFYYLPSISPTLALFPSLTIWSVNPTTDRFMSIIFTNIDQVGLFSIIAISCCFYFGRTVRKAVFFLLPLLLLPVFAGYQRSVLLGVIVCVMFFLWHVLTGRKRAACVYVALALVAMMYVADSSRLFVEKVGSGLGGSTREDYFSAESMENRLGLQLRAVELIIYSFPFGVGPGMTPVAMSSPIHQNFFGLSFPEVSDYSALTYGQVSSGLRTTNAHNFFIEFIVEQGLLGILVFVALFYILIRSFSSWVRHAHQHPDRHSNIFLLQLCIYALLAGIGAHEMFECTFFPYPIYFMFLYFVVFLPSLGRTASVLVQRPPLPSQAILAA